MKPTTLILAVCAASVLAAASIAQAQPRSNNMNADMSYTVPMPSNRPDLNPYASFDIQWMVQMQNGHHVLSFALPEDLQAGGDTTIQMKDTNPNAQVGQPANFEGPNGTATCNGGDWDTVTCNVQFQNLPAITQSQSDQWLNSQYGTGSQDAQERQAVADTFQLEPIGTVQMAENCPACKVGGFRFQYQTNGTFTGDWGNGQIYGQNPQGAWDGQR